MEAATSFFGASFTAALAPEGTPIGAVPCCRLALGSGDVEVRLLVASKGPTTLDRVRPPCVSEVVRGAAVTLALPEAELHSATDGGEVEAAAGLSFAPRGCRGGGEPLLVVLPLLEAPAPCFQTSWQDDASFPDGNTAA